MARAIEKGATYLDKLCHKLYDEPKGRGFQVDGKCRRCGGPLMTYYCEDRLHLIACEKCGTLALTKAVSPQVAANLTLRQPTLTPPNEPLTPDELREMDGEPVWCKWLLSEDRAIEQGKWFIVISGDKEGLEIKRPAEYGCHFCKIDDCGKTWLAYRHPPEGEADGE